MAGWTVLVYLLFPVPLLCLLLLCLPLPGNIGKYIRRTILTLVDKILFTPLVAGFNLYQICIVLSSMLFLMSSYETARAATKLDESRNILMDLKEDRLRCQKWRAERNFWISLMSLVLWLVLYRVNVMSNELVLLNAELAEKEKTK
jgi:hypothetical protein